MEKLKTEQTKVVVVIIIIIIINSSSVYFFLSLQYPIYFTILLLFTYTYVENYIKLHTKSAGLKRCGTQEVSVAMI